MMDEKDLTTVTGKPITVATGFRLPVSLYQQVVKYAQAKGETVSSATWKLWQREIELNKQGQGDDANA